MFIVDVDVDVDVNGDGDGDSDDGRDRDLWCRHIYSCHQHSRGKRLGREEAARKGFSKSLCNHKYNSSLLDWLSLLTQTTHWQTTNHFTPYVR